MPRMSILMPVRNAERHVGDAVRSALRALPADAEVAVLDDASTDNSASVVEQIRDKRVRLIRSSVNLGHTAARNALVATTDSEFVGCLDADDLCVRSRFAHQLHEIAAGAAVSFGTLLHFGNGFLWPRPGTKLRLSADAVPIALLLGNPLGHSTMFARRQSLGGNSPYPDCPSEDYALWLRLAAQGVPIVKCARPLAKYRHHPNQMTQSAQWNDRRLTDQETIRDAYNQLAVRVTGIVPSADHPIWGPWGSEKGIDREYVRILKARIASATAGDRVFLELLGQSRGIR